MRWTGTKKGLLKGLHKSTRKNIFLDTRSVLFNGTNADVRWADSSFDTLANGTISIWIRPTSVTATMEIFCCTINGTTNNCIIGVRSTGSIFINTRVGNINQYDADTPTGIIVANNWYHIAWSHPTDTTTAGAHRVYVNGVSYPLTYNVSLSLTPYFSSVVGTKRYTLGNFRRNTSGNYFVGYMSNFCLFNRGLMGEAILKLYNNGRPVNPQQFSFSDALICWLKMGNGDTYPTLKDSQDSYNGTMTNMAASDITNLTPFGFV